MLNIKNLIIKIAEKTSDIKSISRVEAIKIRNKLDSMDDYDTTEKFMIANNYCDCPRCIRAAEELHKQLNQC